ncbi:MAG: BatD family protein [Blastocatellia bacterium]
MYGKAGKFNKFSFIVFWLLAFLLIFIQNKAILAAGQVSVSINKKQISLSDTVNLTIVFKGVGVERIPLPALFPSSFAIISQSDKPSLSQDASGRAISSRVIRYELQPTVAGKFRIATFAVTANGEIYSSAGEVLEVKGGTKAPPIASIKPEKGERAENQPENLPTIIPNIPIDVRLVTELNQKQAYVGQSVILSVRLLSTTSVDQIKPAEIPAFANFLNKEIPLSKQSADYKEVLINNRPYASQIIHQFNLFPTTSGKLTIPSLTYSMIAGNTSQKSKSLTAKTTPISFPVIALPSQNQPAEFSGLVGKSKLNVSLKDSETSVGVPTKLLIEVENEGNLELISPPPNPTTQSDLKLYSAKPVKLTDVEKKFSNKARWEVEVIASKEGKFTIPPFSFAYFDPELKKYEVIETKPLSLQVTPAANMAVKSLQPTKKSSPFSFSPILRYSLILLLLLAGIIVAIKFKSLTGNTLATAIPATTNSKIEDLPNIPIQKQPSPISPIVKKPEVVPTPKVAPIASPKVEEKIEKPLPIVTKTEPVKPVVAKTEPVIAKTESVVAKTEPIKPVVTKTEPAIAKTEPIIPITKATTTPTIVNKPKPETKDLKSEISRAVNVAYGKLHRGDERTYAKEILKALRLAFELKFGKTTLEISVEKLQEMLEQHKVNKDLAASIVKLYQECELLCFSPTETEHVPNSEKDFERFTKVRTLIEKFISVR